MSRRFCVQLLCLCFNTGSSVDLVSLSTRLLSQKTREFLPDHLFLCIFLPDATSNSETTRKLLLCSRNQPEPNSHELFLPISFKFRPTANNYAVISRPNPRPFPAHIGTSKCGLAPPSHPSSQSLSGTVLCKTLAPCQARITRLFPIIQS